MYQTRLLEMKLGQKCVHGRSRTGCDPPVLKILSFIISTGRTGWKILLAVMYGQNLPIQFLTSATQRYKQCGVQD